jgi:sugar lactone lactonase YvrE
MHAPRILLSDLVIGESPRWHDGRLWFCHWGPDEIVAVDVDEYDTDGYDADEYDADEYGADGRSEVVSADPDVRPHSIDWLPDGSQLIVVKKPDERRLVRREPDGTLVPYGDVGSLPSGFNEIVVDGRGNTYVNGADFDFLAFIERVASEGDQAQQVPLQERPDYVPGYIALVTPDGTARQVAGDIAFPNGMVVTPDNSTLVISESFAGQLTAFDIEPDGGLSNRRVWADGLGPDGITMDADGAIWTSSGGNACIRVREGGEVLDRVELDRAPFACMLGGPDGRTLFVMAAKWNPTDPFGARTGQLLTVRAPAPRVGWP